MSIKDGREYRSIALTAFGSPDDGGERESYVVEGYATTFDQPYELYDGYHEVIDRHALDGADMSDVIFLLNHTGAVMARNRNNTLAIGMDDHGLFVHADLAGSAAGRELHESIQNGLIDRMSWSFKVADDGWEYDQETRTSTITRISKVYDVSAVSIPANDFTDIKARSYFDGVIEMEAGEFSERVNDRDERDRLALIMSLLKIGE